MTEIRPDDLLDQARKLVESNNRRPTQISLRRATSNSYYAVFHELTLMMATHALGGSQADPSKVSKVRRQLSHAEVAKVCESIGKKQYSKGLHGQIYGACVANKDLVEACRIVADLQEARHDADYDHNATFDKALTEVWINSAVTALATFRGLQSPCSGAFRSLLLIRALG